MCIRDREQPVLNTTAELCHAYIILLTGRTDEVPVWLKNTDNAQTNLIFDGIGFTYIVAGRLLMMEQDDIRLEIMCQEYQRRFDIHSCQFGYIFNDIYCSVAKYRLYGREAVSYTHLSLAFPGPHSSFTFCSNMYSPIVS